MYINVVCVYVRSYVSHVYCCQSEFSLKIISLNKIYISPYMEGASDGVYSTPRILNIFRWVCVFTTSCQLITFSSHSIISLLGLRRQYTARPFPLAVCLLWLYVYCLYQWFCPYKYTQTNVIQKKTFLYTTLTFQTMLMGLNSLQNQFIHFSWPVISMKLTLTDENKRFYPWQL